MFKKNCWLIFVATLFQYGCFLADTAVCLVVILQHPKIIGLSSVHSLKPVLEMPHKITRNEKCSPPFPLPIPSPISPYTLLSTHRKNRPNSYMP